MLLTRVAVPQYPSKENWTCKSLFPTISHVWSRWNSWIVYSLAKLFSTFTFPMAYRFLAKSWSHSWQVASKPHPNGAGIQEDNHSPEERKALFWRLLKNWPLLNQGRPDLKTCEDLWPYILLGQRLKGKEKPLLERPVGRGLRILLGWIFPFDWPSGSRKQVLLAEYTEATKLLNLLPV